MERREKSSFLVTPLIIAMGALPLAAFYMDRTPVAASPSQLSNEALLSATGQFPQPLEMSKLEFPVVVDYSSKKGEDLYSLYKKFHIETYSVRSSNDLEFSTFPPGTLLHLPNQQGTLYEVDEPESLHVLSQKFARGKKYGLGFDKEILEANNYPLPDLHQPDNPFPKGTILFLPVVRKMMGLGTPLVGGYRQTSRFGQRKHPVLGITRMHSGLDLAKPYGSPVVPAREGVVIYADWMGGYGNMIEIRHVIKSKSGTRTLSTRYGHLSKIYVHVGQKVRLGQMIGRVGSTGISTGPHLHFEVRDDGGTARNPSKFL